jgi:site-specific recombinase XerD
MTNVDEDRGKRSILNGHEFDLLLAQARENECDFLQVRNPAVLCMVRITGKRRAEIAALKKDDVWVDDHYIYINFGLLKKHKDKVPYKVRAISVEDPFSLPILNYINYVDVNYPDSENFWIGVWPVFGNYVVRPDIGLTGRQVYNIVRKCGDMAGISVWPHLFRETAGGETIKSDPTVYGVKKVMDRIDVTERTAWAYMDRHVTSVINRPIEKE